MRNVTAESGVINKEIKRIFFQPVRSLMKIRTKMGPRTLPWCTPALTGRGDERIPFGTTHWLTRVEEVIDTRVELALDSIGRQFGEQDRMPDCIKSSRYVQR